MDRKGKKHNNEKSAEVIRKQVDDLVMVDIWRDRNQNVKRWSYQRTKPTIAGSRIDYALVSTGLSQNVKSSFYVSSILTDHSAFFLSVSYTETYRGPGYWKFNNKYISDPSFVEEMNLLLDNKIHELSHIPLKDRWELIKFEASNFSQNWARQKASERRLIISQLHEKVTELEDELSMQYEEKKQDILTRTKEDLNELEIERAKGTIFRTRSKWTIEGERNTAYFFGLEKNKYLAKNCSCVITDDGKRITEPKRILEEQAKFYKELYTSNKRVRFTARNCTNQRITNEQKEMLEANISYEEVQNALKGMANGKCPGMDGLTVDFYKMFFNKLGRTFHEVILEVMKTNTLYKSAKMGVINLIPKPKRDSRKLKNLRPISLLNVDFKIMEKILANRLKSVLNDLIGSQQKGFLENRRISSNIRKMLDIIQHATDEELDGLIVSVDFKKCFDLIEHKAVYGALKFFGVGNNYVNMIKTMYTDVVAVVQNYGYFSTPFNIERGVRQGAPNSSYLFLLCAEVLAIMFKEEASIQGIPIAEMTHLLGQYADDMDSYMLACEHNLRQFFGVLERFHLQSGLTVNYDKTTIYRIGSFKDSSAKYYAEKPLHWTSDGINVLGVTIKQDLNELVNSNYQPLIEKAEGILRQWKRRKLSLIGKIMIINTLIASLFVYKMMVIPRMTISMNNQLESMFSEFIWNGRPKIAMDILRLNKLSGGLNLVDLRKKDAALKATWSQILLNDEPLASIVYNQMNTPLKHKVWLTNLNSKDVRATFPKLNEFWIQVMEAWTDTSFETVVETPGTQILWYNSHIKIDGKICVWKESYKNGLCYVRDLFHNGKLKSIMELQTRYKLNLMQSNSLVSAIPKSWRKSLEKSEQVICGDVVETKAEKMLRKPNLSKAIYIGSTHDTDYMCYKRRKWETDLEMVIPNKEFLKSFTNINRTTNITKLRSFQYRLLQRGLVTNIHLHKWKIKDSPSAGYAKRNQRRSFTFLLRVHC